MVPLAWLAGDSAAGVLAFDAVEAKYTAAVDASINAGKRVFTGSVADGVWHAPGKGSFVAQWIEDAGGIMPLRLLMTKATWLWVWNRCSNWCPTQTLGCL